jgi:hypothetical protein
VVDAGPLAIAVPLAAPTPIHVNATVGPSSLIRMSFLVACRPSLKGNNPRMTNDAAEIYRRRAEDCCQRSLGAPTPADKVTWLEIAEEWQKLADAEEMRKGATISRTEA